MIRRFKIKLLNFLLSHLFNAVTEDDLLRYNNKTHRLQIGGNEVTANHLRGLQSDILVIKDLEYWKQLTTDMKYIANKKMYLESKNIDDMLFGKAMLYTLDVMERKMNKLLTIK